MGVDFVYMFDDDMILGKRMIEIMVYIGVIDKYCNLVLGSIGCIFLF